MPALKIKQMGEHADDILNGDVDEITGEWLGNGQGFPRTMQKRHHNDEISHRTKHITKKFVGLECTMLQGNGLNIKLPKGGVITVWWKKGKWCNSNTGKWNLFVDKPNAEKEMELIINSIINPTAKQQVITDNGVQKCIDHVKAKLAKVKAAGVKVDGELMLLVISQELEQYL